MNNIYAKTIALVLAAILLFTGGAFLGSLQSFNVNIEGDIGVNGNAGAQVNATVPTQSTTTTTAPVQTTAPATTAPSDTTTTAPAVSTTAPSASQPAQNSGEKSVQEIVDLYNSAVSGVKTNATTLTRNYKHMESLPEYLEMPSAIQGIAETAMTQFVKGTDEPQSWTLKEDMQIIFPVGSTEDCSKITADMVESATCTDNGSTYQLEIKLYDDKITSPEKGQGYAGAFNTITASTLTDISIPGVTFNKVDVNGINGSISCTVDKANNRVTDIVFRNTDILAMDVKVFVGNLQAKLALAVEESFTVEY